MRVLLDTHVFLWFITDDPKLSATGRSTIADPANDILISPASLLGSRHQSQRRKVSAECSFRDVHHTGHRR